MSVAHRQIGLILLALALAACGMTSQRTITPGVTKAGKLRVTIEEGWYRAPGDETQEKRPSTRVFTRNGLDTDRLYLVGGVDNGQTIFQESHASGADPFDAGMSSADLASLAASSLGIALRVDGVTARNVTERGFTGVPGVQFELEVTGGTLAGHRGIAGAFVADERLYAVIYLAQAAEYGQRSQEIERMLDSAILTIKTIRR